MEVASSTRSVEAPSPCHQLSPGEESEDPCIIAFISGPESHERGPKNKKKRTRVTKHGGVYFVCP